MTKLNHTSGPWWVEEDDINGQPQIVNEDSLIAIVCHECVKSKEELKANANMLAAAPNLVAALQEALKSLEYVELVLVPPMHSQFSDSIHEARLALKKAGVL